LRAHRLQNCRGSQSAAGTSVLRKEVRAIELTVAMVLLIVILRITS